MWNTDNLPTYIRRGILTLLILITALIQNTRGGFPTLFGAHALLTVPLTVTVAMFERSSAGLALGLFAGLLCDMCSAGTDGFYAIFLASAGFICGTLITYYMRNNLVTAFVLSLTADVLCSVLYWLFFVAFRTPGESLYLLVRYYLLSAVYTTAFTPVYYFIVMKLSEKIKKPRRTFTY